jgi:glucokinase
MFTLGGLETGGCLAIEASQKGLLRITKVTSSLRPKLGEIWQTEVDGVPTFTDALQLYERQTGEKIHGLRCGMAVAGATSGETLSPARSRWTITRCGLTAIIGEPAIIINDVAARAWAIISGMARIENYRGFGHPEFRPGRYATIMVEEGVGSCIIDVDRRGTIRILEAEAGHMQFPPSNETELKLGGALAGTAPCATWEMILMLDRSDTVWSRVCPEMSERDRASLQAEILGRFVVDVMNAYAAWDGVLITGSRGHRMLDSGNRSSFENAFLSRRNFHRLIRTCPVWRVEQREAVLTGVAECLAHSAQMLPVQRAA